MGITIPPLEYAQIVLAAENCLKAANPNRVIPVLIEDIIDVNYKIDIVPSPNLLDGFGTFAFITRDLKEIRVDDLVYRRQPHRLRFSLAHELAHLVLHKEVYRQLNFNTPQQWKEQMGHLATSTYRELESQADIFAGLVLVPPQEIRNKFAEIERTLGQTNEQFKTLDQKVRTYTVRALARIFDVEADTIWTRLYDEGFIT